MVAELICEWNHRVAWSYSYSHLTRCNNPTMFVPRASNRLSARTWTWRKVHPSQVSPLHPSTAKILTPRLCPRARHPRLNGSRDPIAADHLPRALSHRPGRKRSPSICRRLPSARKNFSPCFCLTRRRTGVLFPNRPEQLPLLWTAQSCLLLLASPRDRRSVARIALPGTHQH